MMSSSIWPEEQKEAITEMTQFFSFIRKEFYHVFRDSKTLLMLFGLPIAQILLFGFALSNEIKDSRIVISDLSRDEGSRKVIEKLSASEHFIVTRSDLSPREIEAAFKKGDIKLAVLFPARFGEDLQHLGSASIQVIGDASDPNTSNTLITYLTGIVQDFQSQNRRSPGSAPLINVETRMLYNPELKGSTNYVPGVLALVLMLVCVLMTSVSIVREKEMGTMEVLLVSPLNPVLLVISKAVPYFALSLVNLAVILILSSTLLDMPLHGSLVLLVALSSLFILTCLAVGLLISNSTGSQQMAMLISLMGMLIPTMLFTGFMFPLENMPWALRAISNIIPSKWYYIIVKSIMIKGLGFSAIWKESLILFIMMLALMAISFKRFKVRLT